MRQINQHQYWQAAVYTKPDVYLKSPTRKKIYTGIFQSRGEAELAGHKLCHEVEGVGYVCLKIDF